MKTAFLQIVNLFFSITPLTRFYGLRAKLLRMAGVDCDKSARIVSSCRIITLNVHIGSDTFIGHQVLITGTESSIISIGNNVDIAPRVVITNGTHHIDMIGEHSAAGAGIGKDIIIEDGVWIGANSTILPGVTIGKKSVIGAGSIVTKDIPPYCVAVGNPCRPVKFWNVELNVFEPAV